MVTEKVRQPNTFQNTSNTQRWTIDIAALSVLSCMAFVGQPFVVPYSLWCSDCMLLLKYIVVNSKLHMKSTIFCTVPFTFEETGKAYTWCLWSRLQGKGFSALAFFIWPTWQYNIMKWIIIIIKLIIDHHLYCKVQRLRMCMFNLRFELSGTKFSFKWTKPAPQSCAVNKSEKMLHCAVLCLLSWLHSAVLRCCALLYCPVLVYYCALCYIVLCSVVLGCTVLSYTLL